MAQVVALGVDIGGTGTKGALVDRSGRIHERARSDTDPRAGTRSILTLVAELLGRAEALGAEVAAVGVGAAGFIDAASGRVTFSPNLEYDDPDIRRAVEAKAQLPAVVDNDANAAVWGERAFGAATGADDVAMVTLGTGVGSGFVVDGRLLHGSTGAGAELGHMVVDPDGPACACGLRGCLEQLAGGRAIARMGREEATLEDDAMTALAGSVDAITARHVSLAANDGDDAALRVLARAGRALAVGLSNVVNIFDPDVIVLGGSVIQAGDPYLRPARERLAEMTAAQRRRPQRVELTALGKDAGILGAAALALGAVP